jgi:hypothetical protein
LAVGDGVRWGAVGGVAVMFAALIFGSVLVFQVFDRNSNSASDTIRPFIITMAPVWGVAIAAATVLLRRPRA